MKPRLFVMEVVDGVLTKVGRATRDLTRAINRAAERDLRADARVVEEAGNEVWPCVRGHVSSKPDADPAHRWAQLVVQRRARVMLDVPKASAPAAAAVIVRACALSLAAKQSNPRMVSMGVRLGKRVRV